MIYKPGEIVLLNGEEHTVREEFGIGVWLVKNNSTIKVFVPESQSHLLSLLSVARKVVVIVMTVIEQYEAAALEYLKAIENDREPAETLKEKTTRYRAIGRKLLGLPPPAIKGAST